MSIYNITQGNCEFIIPELKCQFHLTYFNPPFNQGKNYYRYNDNLPAIEYWKFIYQTLKDIYEKTVKGGAIYFMHREKNTREVLSVLEKSGFIIQSLIIWKKLTSAVPQKFRFSKSYQIIIFATKGERPRVFNRLRIDKPAPSHYKINRDKGILVTDIWDDIRELTSGYLAGEEAILINNGTLFSKEGDRFHNQQDPIDLLLRIILTSSIPGDTIFDPFAGTGTCSIVCNQLDRRSIATEINPENIECIKKRIALERHIDNLTKCKIKVNGKQFSSRKEYHRFSKDLDQIWTGNVNPLVIDPIQVNKEKTQPLKKGIEKFF